LAVSFARRFLQYPANGFALALIAALAMLAVAAPWLAAAQSDERWVRPNLPEPPSAAHPFGTTPRGEDIYRPLIWGTRDAFHFGLIVTGMTALLGVTIGAVAGYAGGLTNTVLMRVTDAFLAFPAIASVWLFGVVMSPGAGQELAPWQAGLFRLGISPVMVALISFSWMPYARLINTNVQRIKQQGFVEAARALGVSHTRIVLRHLVPNAMGPAVVLAARDVGGMVVLAVAFTFIGLGFGGTQWGALLVASRSFIVGLGGNPLRYWWTFVPVTLALTIFGLGWNLLGDGLNRLLDPRTGQDVRRRIGWRSRTT
jgi:peptide/nickel transport system permease protein